MMTEIFLTSQLASAHNSASQMFNVLPQLAEPVAIATAFRSSTTGYKALTLPKTPKT